MGLLSSQQAQLLLNVPSQCHGHCTPLLCVCGENSKEMVAFKGNSFRLRFLSNKPVSPSCKAKLSLSSLVPFRPLGPEGSSKECSELGTSKLLSCSGQVES